ncbi:MAG: hypothetical protein R3305_10825, partial [Gammaproteobacteria bacterium]|nr:hypothetical protein [Gammaproteobacteria bacterium]
QSEPIETDWRAYAQLTAEHQDGDGGIDFGADRIRFRGDIRHGRLSGAVQLDLGVRNLGDSEPGSVANVINDLYLNYDIDGRHSVRFGEFKMPLGMDFNVSGGSLDITKRGIEAGLVLQRNLGLMMSGRNLGSFGYDVGVFNIAGRSPATDYLESQEGDDNAFAVRGHFDRGNWHAELAVGQTPEAGGPGTADYEVADFGLRYMADGWNAKFEWIDGENVRGNSLREEDVFYVHGGYSLNPRLELVARHYEGESRIAGSATELGNTYLGITWQAHESERLYGRLQVNYVMASGDEAAYTGVRGFRDDAVLVQFQFDVRK